MATKRRRGHYCRICARTLANERFSGKGHRIHVCKECSKLPKAERFRMESQDRLWSFLFGQSRISKKNMTELAGLAQVDDPEISRLAEVVLELARLRPSKRKRFRGLRRHHPGLWQRMIEVGIVVDDYVPPPEDGWEPDSRYWDPDPNPTDWVDSADNGFRRGYRVNVRNDAFSVAQPFTWFADPCETEFWFTFPSGPGMPETTETMEPEADRRQ